MISTRSLSGLPDVEGFRRLTQSLAALDAVLSPEWEWRRYSFNSTWADGEMWASMRTGGGDSWCAVLTAAGAALSGLAHESSSFTPGEPKPWVFADLPAVFHAPLRDEPAADASNATFCLWRETGDAGWHAGTPPPDVDDGSAGLLSILDGDPQRYVDLALDVYERVLPLAAVRAVYDHAPLEASLINDLNPEADRIQLDADLLEIGYPAAS